MVRLGRTRGGGDSMMRLWRQLAILGIAVLSSSVVQASERLHWDRLADLLDAEGFAGFFAGMVRDGENEVLLVVGGANFPNLRPWEDGKKVYHRKVFALPMTEGADWTTLTEQWSEEVGYGMSITLPRRGRALFLGGKNFDGATGRERVLSSVREVWLEGGKLKTRPVVDLPVPCAEGVASLVGTQVVVAAPRRAFLWYRELARGSRLSRRDGGSWLLVHASQGRREYRGLLSGRAVDSVLGGRVIDFRHHAEFADLHGNPGACLRFGHGMGRRAAPDPPRGAARGVLLPALLPQVGFHHLFRDRVSGGFFVGKRGDRREGLTVHG